jgi:large-conductance mechanosensitive channel
MANLVWLLIGLIMGLAFDWIVSKLIKGCDENE